MYHGCVNTLMLPTADTRLLPSRPKTTHHQCGITDPCHKAHLEQFQSALHSDDNALVLHVAKRKGSTNGNKLKVKKKQITSISPYVKGWNTMLLPTRVILIPNTFLHAHVVCFDRHAAGERTIPVGHLHIAQSLTCTFTVSEAGPKPT